LQNCKTATPENSGTLIEPTSAKLRILRNKTYICRMKIRAAAAASTETGRPTVVLTTTYQMLNSSGCQINVQFCPVQINETEQRCCRGQRGDSLDSVETCVVIDDPRLRRRQYADAWYSATLR